MNKDGLILHLCVVADTHIDILHPDPERPKRHLFNAIKDSRSAQPPMDAFIIVGDTTSRSSEINWEMTEEVFKKAGRPAKRTLIAIGNHDTWCDEEDKTAIERYLRHTCNITGEKHEKTYFSTIINGCHLIFLGAEDDNGCEAYISDEQAEWFRDEMASAGESRLPVLVFCHQSLNGKHGLPRTFSCDESDTGEMDGGIGEKSGFIEAVMKEHKNVFFFSGHSHMGFGGDKCFAENGYSSFERYGDMTLINLPSLACGNHHGEIKEFGLGLEIEVYPDRLIMRPRSFDEGRYLDEFAVQGNSSCYTVRFTETEGVI